MRVFAAIASLFFVAVQVEARDILLMVSGAENAPQITKLDPLLNRTAADEFQKLVQQVNSDVGALRGPVVLHLPVADLMDLSEALEKKKIEKGLTDSDRVTMLYFQGHGNVNKFYLHREAGYTGAQFAKILVDRAMRKHLSKDVGIYFGACNCGESLKPDGFQMQFMQEFKNENEALSATERIRSLISLAHRYMSSSLSFRAESHRFDAVLYKLGVFTAIENVNNLFFTMFGHVGLALSTPLVTGATAAMVAIGRTYLGPDFMDGFFYDYFATLNTAVFFSHGVLNNWSAKWTRRMELRSNEIKILDHLTGAGNEVKKMIRYRRQTCEALF